MLNIDGDILRGIEIRADQIINQPWLYEDDPDMALIEALDVRALLSKIQDLEAEINFLIANMIIGD